MRMSRPLQRMIHTFKLGKLLSLIFAGSLFTFAMMWFVYDFPNHLDSLVGRFGFRTSESSLAVFVLSNRDATDRREAIRKTWALGHKNVFFVVSEQYCLLPPENRVLDTCKQNNYSLTRERLKTYLDKEDAITRKLLEEPDVILVPTGDNISELPRKVMESYIWALRTLRAEWFLHIEDSVEVRVDKFENYLKTAFDKSKNIAILSSVERESAIGSGRNTEKQTFQGQFMCGLNHIVSRSVTEYAVSSFSTLFEYIHKHSYNGIRLAEFLNVTLERYINLRFIGKGGCNMSKALQLELCLKHNQNNSFSKISSVKTEPSKNARNTFYTLFENPSTYLRSDRFDLIFKIVYAHFYVFKTRVPKVIKDAYIEHIKVWNNFSEFCNNINKMWYDSGKPCAEKRSSSDFISTYHNTINTIKTFGFNSSLSRIPVDKTGFLLNGAHRLAASVVLSKYPTFEHHNYEKRFNWGYGYFKSIGLSERTINFVMLEWMKLQMQLPYLKSLVSIVSVFSNNPDKDESMRKIVKEKCSNDNGILYEMTVNVTKNGARQLVTHMYGQQSWLETKIQQMLSKFKFSTYRVLFLFVYGKDINDLVQCKDEIRKLYNDKIFKSTAHIPDTPEENLILAEMILNPNSLQFLNHAKDASDCNRISREIASRSFTQAIKTLPGMYLGRDDIMIDSGAVLGFFGLRKRTDVDILFLKDVDKSILGDRHGLTIQAHAFKFNSISNERAWGEDHFSENGPKDQWDLFYDPQNYGYCYGIKFVSLQQMIRYKTRRNEPKKDQYDVRLVNGLLKSIAQSTSSCSRIFANSRLLFCIWFILISSSISF